MTSTERKQRDVFGHNEQPTEPAKLTNAQARDYIDGGGLHCPYCNAEDISGGSVDIESGRAYQTVTCTGCNRSWRDEYTLTALLETE